jgi:transmembrane 9 superfamily protein 2/4
MFVDLVESSKTQIPYAYSKLPYCHSTSAEVQEDGGELSNSLGSKLQGGALRLLPYDLFSSSDVACAVLCAKAMSPSSYHRFRMLIEDEYRLHFVLDSLPIVMRSEALSYVVRGVPVGFKVPTGTYDKYLQGEGGLGGEGSEPKDLQGDAQSFDYYLYNHLRFTVHYHSDPSFTGVRVVGFEVAPFSVAHTFESGRPLESWNPQDLATTNKLKTCSALHPAVNDPASFVKLGHIKENEWVLFTYDVDWLPSKVTWTNRWDIYLAGNPDAEIHVFAIVNSLMVILFLSGVVAMILLRTLHREIAEYNELSTLEEAREESGWKLVHANVFRPPRFRPLWLAVFVGSGVHILGAALIIVLAACAKAINPAMDKGGALTSVILLYVFSGSVGGYYSARIYKYMGGKDWKKNTLVTALFFPGFIVALFVFLNCCLVYKGAATAVSFTTILAVFLLWVGVSTPLFFVGSYFGFRKEAYRSPLKTSQIARHIAPPANFYSSPIFLIFAGGLLPFGSVCIELFFIMSSLWLSQIYYVFGFLFVVLLILVLTCAEISIVLTYFQLCNEDYNWWWRSFLSCASSGVYLFLYSVWYYNTKLDLEGGVTAIVYFTYNAMVSMAFALLTGSIGFFSSMIFVRSIYGALKVD